MDTMYLQFASLGLFTIVTRLELQYSHVQAFS